MKKFLFYLVLTLGAITFIYPFLWMTSASLRPMSEIGSLNLFSLNCSFENYDIVFNKIPIGRAFLNSVIVAGLMTLSVLFFSSITGYALSRLKFFGKDFIFTIIMFTMMIPFQLTLIPLYTLMVKLGWPDTYQSLIIPGAISAMGIMIFRQTFLGIPQSLVEAAKMEGCNHFQILFKIFIPLCKPAAVTVGIVTFMGAWNEVLWPMVVIRDRSMMTMPQLITLFSVGGESGGQLGVQLAAAMILIIPIVITYIFFQRYFIEGIASSGIKG